MANEEATKKGKIIVYDLSAIPHGVSAQRIMDTAKEQGVLFYNSKLGPAPFLMEYGTMELRDMEIVDVEVNPELFFRLITNT